MVLLWSHHLLLFLFLSGENQVRIKTLNDSRLGKSRSAKTKFWVRGSVYPLERYLMRGSILLSPELGLYNELGTWEQIGQRSNSLLG